MSEPSIAGVEIDAAEPRAVLDADQATAQPESPKPTEKVRTGSLWSDAWHDLRRRPLFIISGVLILLFFLMAVFPQLFTSADPARGDLSRSFDPPSAKAWFGYDLQGYDLYARTIYGARASILVGTLTVLGTTLIGGIVGIIAGYYGGFFDSLLSRIGDVFFSLPFLLGSIVILSTFAPQGRTSEVRVISLVVGALVVLGWPQVARIMRSSVISAKQLDYVQAARALGAGPFRIIFRHLLPNCLAPVIVLGTISLGAYIGAEATLSYLGIGLQAPVVSWGIEINDAANYLRVHPLALIFPATFLTVAVLSFVMLGDAVREALDPKLR
jgi:oligopeptide transport system permease protein